MNETIKTLIENYTKTKLTLPVGFFLVLITVLLVIIVPNFNQISEKLGFDTRTTLEKKLTERDNAIDRLGEGNKDLSLTIDKLKESNAVDLKAVVSDVEHKKEVDTVLSEVKVEAKKRFDNLKLSKTTAAKKATVKNAAEADQIAEIQITTIWDAFCKTTHHADCPKTI